MIENLYHEGTILAIIIKENFHKEGIKFFTPDIFSQQLADMNKSKHYIIEPHVNNIKFNRKLN